MNIRQTIGWGEYLKSIGWFVEKTGQTQIFIRKIPLLNFSLIKVQHQTNPLPLNKIDQLAQKKKALFIIIESLDKNFKKEDLMKAGYKPTKQPIVHTATIQINLKPTLKEIYNSFSENARRNIKKAQSYNLKVKSYNIKGRNGQIQFEIFLKLLKNLIAIKKFWVPSDEEMHKKVTSLKNSVIFFAYEKNKKSPVAAVWVSYTSDSVHYIQTGITQKGYQTLANYLLVWEIIKASKKPPLKYFDFEGIYDPRYPKFHKRWKNFSEFKKRFHGKLIEYPPSYVKFYNPMFKIFYYVGNFLT